MSKGAAKVSVLCGDKGLGKLIRRADKAQRLKEVVTASGRPVYEYDPVIHVHVPIPLDLRPLPKDAHPRAKLEHQLRTLGGHLHTPWFEEPLGAQVGNLRDAIRENLVLSVVFVECLRFGPLFWEMRQQPACTFEGYAAEVLEGLLPVWEISKPGFLFKPQPEPDTILEPTPEARPWIEALQPFFSEPVGARIEACAPSVRDCSPEAVKAVAEMIERLYSHPITGIPPTRFHGSIPVRIEPVLRNKVGDWLACGVRIGQGAVLLLPQCRDQRAEAALIVKLATEQWGAVQEWLESSPKPASAPAPVQPAAPMPAGQASEARAVTGPETTGQPDTEPVNRFVPQGHFWQLQFGAESGLIKDSKGMQRIAVLLSYRDSPKPVPALKLLGLNEDLAKLEDTFQPVLDEHAKREFRNKIEDLDSRIEEAEKNNDFAGAGHLKEQRGSIIEELSHARGLGGRDRRLGGKPPAQRAANAVKLSLGRVYTGLRQAKPPMKSLAAHLSESIRPEGNAFAYRPDVQTPPWQL